MSNSSNSDCMHGKSEWVQQKAAKSQQWLATNRTNNDLSPWSLRHNLFLLNKKSKKFPFRSSEIVCDRVRKSEKWSDLFSFAPNQFICVSRVCIAWWKYMVCVHAIHTYLCCIVIFLCMIDRWSKRECGWTRAHVIVLACSLASFSLSQIVA